MRFTGVLLFLSSPVSRITVCIWERETSREVLKQALGARTVSPRLTSHRSTFGLAYSAWKTTPTSASPVPPGGSHKSGTNMQDEERNSCADVKTLMDRETRNPTTESHPGPLNKSEHTVPQNRTPNPALNSTEIRKIRWKFIFFVFHIF